MESYSRDQQPAHFDISVIYHIPPDKVDEVYARYRNEEGVLERLLDRHVYQQAKVVFGGYTALSVIQDRAKFNADVAKAITDVVVDQPIVVESVNVEDIKFSPDYENAVRLRMIAEVEVQKIKQQAEQQKVNAEITIINANAEAEKTRAEAQGRADATLMQAKATAEATRMQGDATAHAIKERGAALAATPELVLLEQAQRWDGKLPVTMVPNGALPMITLPQAPKAEFAHKAPQQPALPGFPQ
jgi:regulator of protease activity HflC (stomatin/prohibitin superfamily)